MIAEFERNSEKEAALRKEALKIIDRLNTGRPNEELLSTIGEFYHYISCLPRSEHWFCNEIWRPIAHATLPYVSFTNETGLCYIKDLNRRILSCARCSRIYHQMISALVDSIRKFWRIEEPLVLKLEERLVEIDDERLKDRFPVWHDDPERDTTETRMAALYDCLYCPKFVLSSTELSRTICHEMKQFGLMDRVEKDLFDGGTPLIVTWLYTFSEDVQDLRQYAQQLFSAEVMGRPKSTMDLPTIKAWAKVLDEFGQMKIALGEFWKVTANIIRNLTSAFVVEQLSSYLNTLVPLVQRAINEQHDPFVVYILEALFDQLSVQRALHTLGTSASTITTQLGPANFPSTKWILQLVKASNSQEDDPNALKTLLSISKVNISNKNTQIIALQAMAKGLSLNVSQSVPLAKDYSCLLRIELMKFIANAADKVISVAGASTEGFEFVQEVIRLSVQLELVCALTVPNETNMRISLWRAFLGSQTNLMRDYRIWRSILLGSAWITSFLVRPTDRKKHDVVLPLDERVVLMTSSLNMICTVILQPEIKRLLDHQEALTNLFVLCFSYNESLHAAAVHVLVQGFSDVGSRQEALRNLLISNPEVSLQAFNNAIKICFDMNQFSVCLRYVRLARDFLEALYGHDGVVDDSFKSRISDQHLLVFWQNSWKLQERMCANTRTWGNQFNHNDMKDFFRDEADYCQSLLDNFRFFETDIPDSFVAGTESIGMMLARPVARAVEEMSDLLKLKDKILVEACFKNFLRILELMRSFRVPAPDGLVETIIKCASREVPTNLTVDNCQSLLDSLIKSGILSDTDVQSINERAESKRKRTIPTTVVVSEASGAKRQKLVNDYFNKASSGYISPTISSRAVEPTAPSKMSQMEALRAEMKLKAGTLKAGSYAMAQAANRPIKDVHPPRPPGFNSKRPTAVPQTVAASSTGDRSIPQEVSDSDSGSDSDMEGLFKEKKNKETLQTNLRNISRPGFQMNSAMVGQRSRAVVDVSKNEENALRNRLGVDLGALHKKLLCWDYFQPENKSPFDESKLEEVRDRYSTVKEYQSALSPLLLLECWHGILKSRAENAGLTRPFYIDVGRRERCDDFTDVHVSMLPENVKSQRLAEADLIVIWRDELKRDIKVPNLPNHLVPHCYARIQSLKSHRDYVDVVLRTYEPGDLLPSLSKGAQIAALKVSSLVTVEREFSSLGGLQHYDLKNNIINGEPRPLKIAQDAEVEKTMSIFGLNRSQAEAVLGSFRGTEGFQLIQGPPGTGKTKTILSIIGSYLTSPDIKPIEQYSSSSAPKRKRLLVCAPSNAAVDELVLRLKKGIVGADRKIMKPGIVRLGRGDAVNEQVRDATLEDLVDREFSGEDESEEQGSKLLREEQTRTVKERNNCRGLLSNPNSELDAMGVSKLTEKIQELNSKIQDLGRQLDIQREQAISDRRARDQKRKDKQAAILFGADVVCCTLSGSAHSVLSQLKIRFDTVIIDEAAQCVELSAVIPLRYGCKHCIMVGDPHQLPPTVLSQKAAGLKYEQSLFVRMFNQYPDRVHLLNTQFRMHPQIAEFPSAEFYKGKLINGPDMALKTKKPWHEIQSSSWKPDHTLQPYMFFAVHGAHSSAPNKKSLRNMAEVELAFDLFSMLLKKSPDFFKNNSIGIISPYKAQVEELRRKFTKMLGETARLIDFNTVDGFQGQEKDVIIFSCVRAQGGGVGFLSDVRRLNVAITRAKSSMWILGNSSILTRNAVWKNLIVDAQNRGLYSQVLNSDGKTRSQICEPQIASTAKITIEAPTSSSASSRGETPKGDTENPSLSKTEASRQGHNSQAPQDRIGGRKRNKDRGRSMSDNRKRSHDRNRDPSSHQMAYRERDYDQNNNNPSIDYRIPQKDRGIDDQESIHGNGRGPPRNDNRPIEDRFASSRNRDRRPDRVEKYKLARYTRDQANKAALGHENTRPANNKSVPLEKLPPPGAPEAVKPVDPRACRTSKPCDPRAP